MVIWRECIHHLVSALRDLASMPTRNVNQRRELGSRKWKKQRELVFRTKGHDCYICGEFATAIDHVISRKRGGGNNIENLEPICKSCNSRKGSKEYSVFLGRKATPPVFPDKSLPETQVTRPLSPFSQP